MDLKSVSPISVSGSAEARVAVQQAASQQSEAVSEKLIESVERTPEPGKGQRLSVEA